MFDRDDSGAVDSEELESFMEVLRRETNVGRTEGGARKGGFTGKNRERERGGGVGVRVGWWVGGGVGMRVG